MQEFNSIGARQSEASENYYARANGKDFASFWLDTTSLFGVLCLMGAIDG